MHFFSNNPAAATFHTLSLHDALPIFLAEKAERLRRLEILRADQHQVTRSQPVLETQEEIERDYRRRSEEHTSELQSRPHLVCRLLLEKKKNKKQNDTQIRDENNNNNK